MEVAGTTVGVVVAGTTDAVGGGAEGVMVGVGLPHPAPSSHSRAVTITKPQRTQTFI